MRILEGTFELLSITIKIQEMFYGSTIMTIYFCLSGLYFLAEAIVLNLIYFIVLATTCYLYGDQSKYYIIYGFLVVVVFNIIDSQQHSDKEYTSFQDLIVIDRKGTHLAEFVDRLLPKHVKSILTFRSTD